MEDQFFVIFIGVIIILSIIIFLKTYFNEDNTITWQSGDAVPKDKPIKITRPNPSPKQDVKKDDFDSIIYIVLGFIVIVAISIIFTQTISKKDLELNKIDKITDNEASLSDTNATDTSSYTEINSANHSPAEVKNKLINYFDAINKKQFFNIQSFFAPVLFTYFPYKNVTNEFVANDVIDFWSNQIQPSKIFYENSIFEVVENSETYEIKGKLLEQSSLYKERIPYWLESEILYVYDHNLKLISLSGNIINKQPDLVRIFEIDDASIDDIRERENTNDFKKYFNLIQKTKAVKPSLANRYINAVKEIYGTQLLIEHKDNFYSFEEFANDKIMLQWANIFGIKSVKNNNNITKIVTISK
jgi:hypothetical protein